ncbi:antibiotic biosynthesis monooxygenase [Herbaspirillum sp. GCM10030257]|uniref:antibiotic biosynthesis monooxygenase n=1 Tax=Herbaspirillum sp. GCM10030257 TaxID=3273393 RepID=UPI00361D47CC
MAQPQQNEIAVSVIVHDVLPERRTDYERWMLDAIAAHRQFEGHLETNIIRPVESGSRYVVILRFVDEEHAKAWLHSPVRRSLLKIAEPWLSHVDRFHVHREADFWFAPFTGRRQPKRWKQWMLSVIAVFPLSVIVPKQIGALAHWAMPSLPDLAAAAVSALTISGLMVYLLMPFLVRLAGSWLLR